MRYFNHLPELHLEGFFYKKPMVVNKYTDRTKLAYSLGPLLYMPATRRDIAQLIMSNKYRELTALAICLEDAVGDLEVAQAEESLISQMATIEAAAAEGRLTDETAPLIFIRVRSPHQMRELSYRLGSSLEQVTGFVFPKFSSKTGESFLAELEQINRQSGTVLYGMPILESPEVLHKERRLDELLHIKEIVGRYEELILNIRIGATDLCGLYGLRRSSQMTVYDIAVVSELITDIVNLFSREPGGYVVSGPVWEYFSNSQRILKPQLRQTPFEKQFGSEGLRLRKELISKNFDGLIQETLLDQANGLVGKTIIHPSHLLPVQAMHVVSKEEYVDALSIVQQANGRKGVFKSEFQNKMNEIKPHLKWAEKILMKSDIYGVFHENSTFIDLLSEPVYT